MVLAAMVELPSREVFYERCEVRLAQQPLFAQRLVWASNGSALVVNAEPAYVVDLHFPSTRIRIRRVHEMRRASAELAARELGEAAELGVGPSRTCRIPTAEAIGRRGVAELVPAIRAVRLNPAGEVWVQRWRFADEGPKTDIFSASGEYVGTLSGDHPFPVAFLGNGDVVTIDVDEVDVRRLVVFRILER